MARVIFCVLLTLEMRFRKDFRSGNGVSPLRCDEALAERLQNGIELGFDVVGDGLLFTQLFPEVRMLFVDMSIDFAFELPEGVDGQLIEKAFRARVDEEHLFFDRKRLELTLFQRFDEPRAALELGARRRVEVARELGEGRHGSILSELQS